MRFTTAAAVVAVVHTVTASLDSFVYYFAGNGGNATALRRCANMPYACNPPNLCAVDNLTKKQYCCVVGSPGAICWANAEKCSGEGTQQPSAQQTGCSSGSNKYCCIKDTEKCTQTQNQINICWNNFENPVKELNATRLNDTFSLLNASNPTAASYAVVDLRQIAQETSSAVPSASSTSIVVSTPSASLPTGSTSPPPAETGLSSGAIGGIAGGVVGSLAVFGLAGWLLWRQRKAAHQEIAEEDIPELSNEGKAYIHLKDGGDILELSRNEKPAELEHPPVELEAREINSDRDSSR